MAGRPGQVVRVEQNDGRGHAAASNKPWPRARTEVPGKGENALMRKYLLAVLGAALSAGQACAQDTIKIGVTEPLTGAFAASGNYVAQGAKIAEDHINAAGGVLGKKIQLIIEDNKSNPTESVATVEKLVVKDKVPVLMGAWSSTLTLAIMPKLEEYKVPWSSRPPPPARSRLPATLMSSASARPRRWRPGTSSRWSPSSASRRPAS
jgi:ABC-type branched-subunit amino acid transport system substrate-binding protein